MDTFKTTICYRNTNNQTQSDRARFKFYNFSNVSSEAQRAFTEQKIKDLRNGHFSIDRIRFGDTYLLSKAQSMNLIREDGTENNIYFNAVRTMALISWLN